MTVPASVGAVAGGILGACLFTALLAWGTMVLVRQAGRAGLLKPVLVGLGLRLALMLIIHAVSLARDEGGIMFLDDRTYLRSGMLIADGWRDGLLFNPGAYDYAGSAMFGYQAICGAAFVLVDDIIATKLLNVLASAGTVLLVGLIAGRVWGAETRVRAAWIAALAPGMVWWAVPQMKEAISAFLLCACVYALLSIGRDRAVRAFGLVLAALILTRIAAAFALLAGAVVLVALVIRHRQELRPRRWGRGALVALASAGVMLIVYSQGSVTSLVDSYTATVNSMIDAYRGEGIAELPISMARALVSPYPWTFDEATHNWDMGLYPGVWVWYALYPAAALGVWRARRRPEVLFIVLLIVAYLAINAYTSGFVFRQRSVIEPLIVILAIGGLTSWRWAVRAGAAAWAIVAVFAAAQSRGDPITILPILAGAGMLWFAGGRLSSAPLFISAPSTLLDGLRGLTVPGIGQLLPLARLRRAAPDPARGTGAVLRRPLVLCLVLAAAAGSTVAVASDLRVDASASAVIDVDLGAGQPGPPVTRTRSITQSVDGYVLAPRSSGTLSFRMSVANLPPGDIQLRVWAANDLGTRARLLLRDSGIDRADLGALGRVSGKAFDVSDAVAASDRELRLVVLARNATDASTLLLDKVQLVTVPAAVGPGVEAWLFAVCTCTLLLVLTVLRSGPAWTHLVPVAAGIFAAICWADVEGLASLPVPLTVEGFWNLAQGGSMFSELGLVYGDFQPHSHLTGQLLHLLGAAVGPEPAAIRSASAILGVVAFAAVCAAAGRVAGGTGVLTAATALTAVDGFRTATAGDPTVACFMLVGALFVWALHRLITRPDIGGVLWLAGAAGLAVLAEPLLAPGATVVLIVAGFRSLDRARARALAAGVLLLIAIVVPNRIAVGAGPADGPFADVRSRATAAHTLETGVRANSLSMTGYILGKHSVPDVLEGTLDGADHAIDAVARRDESGIFGLLAIFVALGGGLYALLVPRLRWLAVAPLGTLLPLLFLADADPAAALNAGAFWLPGLLACAGAAVYALASPLRAVPLSRVKTNWLQPQPPAHVNSR